MKKIISLLLVLIICIGVCMTPVQAAGENVFYKTRDDFYWGFNHHAPHFSCYPVEYLEERIHLCAKAGSTMIRINLNMQSDAKGWEYQDQVVGLCNKYGLKIIGTFIPPIDDGPEYAYLSCKTMAERYNGKNGRGFVDYIQVGNETNVVLIKAKYGNSAPDGKQMDHYYTIPVEGAADLPEYTEYFQAAANGIHDADSDTQFMINFNYKQYGAIRWYLKEGVKIDAIGWDWYTHGNTVEESDAEFTEICDDLYTDIVKDTGIPVLICETNSMTYITDIEASHKLENYNQLLGIFRIAYSYDWIKALCVYELLDEPNLAPSKEARYGMVDCELGGIIGEPKPIYWEIQRLWGGNENMPMLDRSIVDLKPYEKLKVDTADDSQIGEENNTDDIIPDIPNIVIPETELDNDNILDEDKNETDNQELITIEPETTVKQMNVTQTSYQMPWLLIILCGVGMLLIVSGVVATFVIIDKKKAKKNSLLE